MAESKLAPIALFAYNRLYLLNKCVASNDDSVESELYVFVDGPRKEKKDDNEKVSSVHEFVKNITGINELLSYLYINICLRDGKKKL